jgi:hypothetical protein
MKSDDDRELLANESMCSRCGLMREEWSANRGKGLMQNGEIYCCLGCANDEGCTCEDDREAPEEEPSGRARRSE